MAEDTKGLPDVDLTPVIDDLKAQDKDQKVDDVKSDTHPDRDEFGQFKTKEAMVEGYKNLQGFSTKVSQENKSHKERIAELEEEVELAKSARSFTPPQNQTDDDKPFDQRLAESPESTLDAMVAQRVATLSIAEVLEEESEKNRGEFNERYGYVQMLSRQYPHLANTGRGIKKLFEMGDKARTEQLKKNAHKGLEFILGKAPTEEEIEKFKSLFKGTEQQTTDKDTTGAFMPDTTSSTKLGADADQTPNRDKEIKDGVDKGDVDATLDAVFLKQLEE